MTAVEAYAEEIDKLVGYTIMGTIITADKGFWGIKVKKGGDEKDIWIDSDPEGNGPGFANVE